MIRASFCDALNAVLKTDTANNRCQSHDNQHVAEEDCGGGHHLPKRFLNKISRRALKVTGQHKCEIVQDPARDDRIEHEEHIVAGDGKIAHDVPLGALRLELSEGRKDALPAESADGVFHGENGDAEQHEAGKVDEDEESAAVLACDVGETPYVSDADGASR